MKWEGRGAASYGRPGCMDFMDAGRTAIQTFVNSVGHEPALGDGVRTAALGHSSNVGLKQRARVDHESDAATGRLPRERIDIDIDIDITALHA